MISRHSLAVFKHCVAIGFRQTIAQKVHLIGVMVMYTAIMVIYSGMIRMIPDSDLAPFALTHVQMIWYLGTTEFVLFSCSSWGMKEVQNDFLSGQADLALLRPVSDSFLRISDWAGQSLARVLLLLIPYFLLILFLAGEATMSIGHFLGLVLSMPCAAFMMLCATYMIGASCLWFVQSEPASWIWQKAIFLFGAMLWPVVFYPVWLRSFVWFTPFPGILMLAGNWTLHMGLASYLLGFVHQILWSFVFYKAVVFVDRAILKRIQTGGL
ncbi:MAG: hypothetical protein PHD48_04915 [Alphaproteobacteria bacterium]|nr:hypothetical protein [Alphaproteobacteria bacterium]